MATTNFASTNDLTLKLWSKTAFRDSVKDTMFGKLMGKSDRSIVQVKDELNKSAGDRVRFRLRALPSGTGVTGDSTLEGNEEGLSYGTFDLNIDAIRHATKVDLLMSQQRTDFDLRTEAKDALAEWWQEYLDTKFFAYLSGNTSATTHAGNTINAPSTNRVVYGGNATSTADIDSSDTFSLSVIDKAVEKAKLASPTFRKAKFDGTDAFVCILHPYQVYDLRTNTNTGQWLDIQKAAMSGGKVSDNPIWSMALGMYNGVILVESTRVPTFSTWGAGGNLGGARALFLGAQAGVVAFGRDYSASASPMKWTEKTFDYGSKFGVATDLIWGIQKSRFSTNSEDFGVIAINTYAAAH